MKYVRVYELAKQYGLTNDQMINFLMTNGIDMFIKILFSF